jgi:hypothetical protein
MLARAGAYSRPGADGDFDSDKFSFANRYRWANHFPFQEIFANQHFFAHHPPNRLATSDVAAQA